MRTIVLWILSWIEKSLDPDLQERLKALNAAVAAAEAKEKEAELLAQQSEAAYEESVKKRQIWTDLLTESQKKEALAEADLKESQNRIQVIEDEASKAKQIIDSRSDHDVLRGSL